MASFNKDLSIFEKSRQCKALVLLDEIQQRRLESDLISFNAVIGACDKNGSRIRRWSCSMRDIFHETTTVSLIHVDKQMALV